ncbi:hypothetical protein [Streptomyces sp. NPDC091416]|uniref:hypothetical protein n=1 Tax=Streptomyces sp. NPDC091416 TaxID=3366003 RepID=UPI0037F6A114
MKSWKRKCVSAAGAAAAIAAISLANPSTAQANSMYGCNYPEVCFTTGSGNHTIFARFKDVTSSWQYLNNPNTDYGAINTRNDDVAYLLESDGGVYCLKPNSTMGTSKTIKAIRISSSATC